MSSYEDTFRGYGGTPPGGYAYDRSSEPDPRWARSQEYIAQLEQRVADMEVEKANLRQQVVAEIRSTAEDSAAVNARIQAFNNEVTPDMDGAAIKALARKHNL